MHKPRDVTLRQALDWYVKHVVPKTPRSAKMKISLVAYWKKSRFADWALPALHPWDLIDWRREVLDEDNAEDGTNVGPGAIFGTQSCMHRLNIISHLYGQWSLIHKVPLDNPVVRGVRPIIDDARERKLDSSRDRKKQTEEDRLFAACDASNSEWLGPAVRIALETCRRRNSPIFAGTTFATRPSAGSSRIPTSATMKSWPSQATFRRKC